MYMAQAFKGNIGVRGVTDMFLSHSPLRNARIAPRSSRDWMLVLPFVDATHDLFHIAPTRMSVGFGVIGKSTLVLIDGDQ
jgi:hypothetical protein